MQRQKNMQKNDCRGKKGIAVQENCDKSSKAPSMKGVTELGCSKKRNAGRAARGKEQSGTERRCCERWYKWDKMVGMGRLL